MTYHSTIPHNHNFARRSHDCCFFSFPPKKWKLYSLEHNQNLQVMMTRERSWRRQGGARSGCWWWNEKSREKTKEEREWGKTEKARQEATKRVWKVRKVTGDKPGFEPSPPPPHPPTSTNRFHFPLHHFIATEKQAGTNKQDTNTNTNSSKNEQFIKFREWCFWRLAHHHFREIGAIHKQHRAFGSAKGVHKPTNKKKTLIPIILSFPPFSSFSSKMVSWISIYFPFSFSTQIRVGDLKARITEKTGIPIENMRLIYQGKVLKDEFTIASYRTQKIFHFKFPFILLEILSFFWGF